jgi:hypothetical protein
LTKLRQCRDCQFYSATHGSCFHPDAWTKEDWHTFKRPGVPEVLNPNGVCLMFDDEPTKEVSHMTNKVGPCGKLKRFFKTIFVFKVTK